MKIPFNKKWTFIEKEDYAHYLFVVQNWEGFTYRQKKWGFVPPQFLGAEYINSSCNLFALKDSFDKANEFAFQAFFTKPQLWDKLHQIDKINSDKLFALAKKIKRLNHPSLTNRQLLNWINQFQEGQAEVHVPRGPMWLLETPDNIFSNYLHNYLAEQAASLRLVSIDPPQAFKVLTTPLKKNIWVQEKEELALISLLKDKKLQDKRLIAHAKKYEWLEYGLKGKILDLNYFQDELKKMKRRGLNKVLRQHQTEIKKLTSQQQEIYWKYKIDPKHRKLFKIARDSLYMRIYSKNAQFFGFYCLEGLLKEVGRRDGLTLEQVRFLAPVDYKKILIDHQDFRQISKQRQKYSLHISAYGKTIFYLGEEAKKIRKKIKFYQESTKIKLTKEIKGQPAYNGRAKGRVKIINTVQEMVKMHAANVLVSHMTNPDIVPAMKMAVAIVTDLGGITCHAAIVARELKKPCVIGTKIATQVLKDGDEVEVDATKGIVKKLK